MDKEKIEKFFSTVIEFRGNLASELIGGNNQQGARDSFFLDNQEKITKCMNRLKAIIDNPNLDQEYKDEASIHYLAIKDVIKKYKESLVISDSVTEEETMIVYDQDNLEKAKQNNSTTKKLMEQLDNIKRNQGTEDIYNYMIMVDESVSLLNIPDNADINTYLAKLPENMIQGKNVRLFKIAATEIPLKRKTVLSVGG